MIDDPDGRAGDRLSTVQADLRSLEAQVDALDDRVELVERQFAAALSAYRSMAELLTEMVETVTGEKVEFPPGLHRRDG